MKYKGMELRQRRQVDLLEDFIRKNAVYLDSLDDQKAQSRSVSQSSLSSSSSELPRNTSFREFDKLWLLSKEHAVKESCYTSKEFSLEDIFIDDDYFKHRRQLKKHNKKLNKQIIKGKKLQCFDIEVPVDGLVTCQVCQMLSEMKMTKVHPVLWKLLHTCCCQS
mmetsp:Transcript_35629/g.45349  ORF Transcript_35629/g.45349 Transcript_35629/m.45349 type:complete len:164 (-) Transcript_35629:336-827(-)